MKMPWSGKTGLAQATAIFAVMFIVSVGLCGANMALFSRFATVSGGTPPPGRPVWASMTLIVTAFIELIGMAVGALGLIVVAIAALISWITRKIATMKHNAEDE